MGTIFVNQAEQSLARDSCPLDGTFVYMGRSATPWADEGDKGASPEPSWSGICSGHSVTPEH